MDITIELSLTEDEREYLLQSCILRVINSAIDAVPEDYDYLDDLMAARRYEGIRKKIVNQLFRKMSEAQNALLS